MGCGASSTPAEPGPTIRIYYGSDNDPSGPVPSVPAPPSLHSAIDEQNHTVLKEGMLLLLDPDASAPYDLPVRAVLTTSRLQLYKQRRGVDAKCEKCVRSLVLGGYFCVADSSLEPPGLAFEISDFHTTLWLAAHTSDEQMSWMCSIGAALVRLLRQSGNPPTRGHSRSGAVLRIRQQHAGSSRSLVAWSDRERRGVEAATLEAIGARRGAWGDEAPELPGGDLEVLSLRAAAEERALREAAFPRAPRRHAAPSAAPPRQPAVCGLCSCALGADEAAAAACSGIAVRWAAVRVLRSRTALLCRRRRAGSRALCATAASR
mmetsp:Transcript_15488/g.52120  ORF Transcript_15488/g.52120 Transcript_15488/m.52120 type:complete len:319 (+) Transcript_15488:65-1021(+)